MLRLRWTLLLAALLVVSCIALADTNFYGPPIAPAPPPGTHDLGVNSITVGPFTVTAYYWNGLQWTSTGVHIVERNETNPDSPDHGIGICSPVEFVMGACPLVGDINELSNQATPEIFQISRNDGQAWTGIGLSSLDNNGRPGPVEHGQLFASSFDVGGSAKNLQPIMFPAFFTLICNFSVSGVTTSIANANAGGFCNRTGGTFIEPDLTFNAQNAKYLYLTAQDLGNLTNLNNDFLLRSIPGGQPPIPEPGTLALLGSGLAAVGMSLRRRFRG